MKKNKISKESKNSEIARDKGVNSTDLLGRLCKVDIAERIAMIIGFVTIGLFPGFLFYSFLEKHHDPLVYHVSILEQQVSKLQESLKELQLQVSYSSEEKTSSVGSFLMPFDKEYLIVSSPLETRLLALKGLQEWERFQQKP